MCKFSNSYFFFIKVYTNHHILAICSKPLLHMRKVFSTKYIINFKMVTPAPPVLWLFQSLEILKYNWYIIDFKLKIQFWLDRSHTIDIFFYSHELNIILLSHEFQSHTTPQITCTNHQYTLQIIHISFIIYILNMNIGVMCLNQHQRHTQTTNTSCKECVSPLFFMFYTWFFESYISYKNKY